MNPTDLELLQLIKKGPGAHMALALECPDDGELMRTLSAFANTRGGWLVIGVDEEGVPQGCAKPKEALTRLRLVVEEDLRPPLDPVVSKLNCDAGQLICVYVKTSFDRPHSVPGETSGREIYVRVGAANHVAEGATLNALRSHRTQGQPKDALEARILAWVGQRERESKEQEGDASPALFSQATNIGLRRASKAFIHLEREGLLIGRGGRAHRLYALP